MGKTGSYFSIYRKRDRLSEVTESALKVASTHVLTPHSRVFFLSSTAARDGSSCLASPEVAFSCCLLMTRLASAHCVLCSSGTAFQKSWAEELVQLVRFDL